MFVAPKSLVDLIPESVDELRNTTVVEVVALSLDAGCGGQGSGSIGVPGGE